MMNGCFIPPQRSEIRRAKPFPESHAPSSPPSPIYPLLVWFPGPWDLELAGGWQAEAGALYPVFAAGRLDHFGFLRGGEVTQSNIQRPRAGSQTQAGRCPERCRCFPPCLWTAGSEGRQLENGWEGGLGRESIYTFIVSFA